MKSHQKNVLSDKFCICFKNFYAEWAKSHAERANTFANPLSEVFRTYPRQVTTEEEDIDILVCSSLVFPCFRIQPITIKDIFSALQSLKYKKAPSYDLITPAVGIILITSIHIWRDTRISS